MNVSLPFKWVLAVAMAGVVTNFVVDDVSDPIMGAAYSPWTSLEDRTVTHRPDLARVGLVFGLTPPSEVVATPPPEPEPDAGYRFTLEGVSYRLSGLVVQGELGSATLIGQAGEAVRVAAGDAMPSGEKIVSISLNELVLLRKDGSSEAVVIYNR
jgi:hypothetical protein